MVLFSMLIAAPLTAAVPSISVNTTSGTSGDAVTVSWTGVSRSPSPMRVTFSTDSAHVHRWEVEPKGASSLWIGQFSPPVLDRQSVHMTSDPQSRGIATEGTPPFTYPAPVKFISGKQLEKGQYEFILTNHRAAINWVLFSGSLTNASDFEVLAISKPVQVSDATAPMHLRLARTSSAGQLRVSWTSAQSDAEAQHVVQWGDYPSKLGRVTTAVTHTYTASDLCGFPANASGFQAPGYFHEAVLDLSVTSAPLQHYRVGSAMFGWSDTHAFATPSAASPHTPLSVVITADMGETYEDGSQYHWAEPAAVNTTVHIARLLKSRGGPGIDLILHPGDLSYATGYESEWDRFMAQIEELSSAVPYMTGQGNHERDFPDSGNSIGGGDSGGECGVPTQARFHMPTCPPPNTAPCLGQKVPHPYPASPPTRGSPAERRRGPVGPADDGWYSFEQGPLHVAMLNTEMPSTPGSRQHTFVAADLAAVDRMRTPWLIVLGHRQMYADNAMAPQNKLGGLEALFVKHKVDLAFWGHVHFAQRSCPMVNATCVKEKDAAGYDAPIHAIIGNAGQNLTPFTLPAAWSMYEGHEWGFSHMTVHNATHLTLDFYADVPLDQHAPRHHTVTLERKFPRV